MTPPIPVFTPYAPAHGPTLSLGMLTASARHAAGGELTATYSIRRIEPWPEVVEALATVDGPAVVLCSNYVWNVDAHLEWAERAHAVNDRVVFVHGGPSTPGYPGDVERFVHDHPDTVHVLVHGEGEQVLVDLLRELAPHLRRGDGAHELEPLPGTTIRTIDGNPARGPDRARIDDLDALPSPYLTGEFDHLGVEAWRGLIYLEATRGCPYGCTFCDWGSSTLARVRKFGLDRLEAEMTWCASHGFPFLAFADANFGMTARDVEIVERLREVREHHGLPDRVLIAPAKNTTRHLRRILDVFTDAGLSYQCQLGIQTTDGGTLADLDRKNIPVEHFVRLAAELRRRRHLLECDLMIGLPGQTVESFRRDLQFMIDHEINHKTWPTLVLPNAPINDPDYRERYAIEVDERRRVVATTSFDRADHERMLRILRVEIITNRLGLLRFVLRYLQWDHGIPAVDVLDRLASLTEPDVDAYPLLSTLLSNYVARPVPPVGWTAVYDEVERFVAVELGVPATSGLRTVLRLERFVRAAPGRTFPATISLDHDVVAYVRGALRRLYADGRPTGPDRPLATYGPGTMTIDSDPLDLCTKGPYVPRLATWTDADVTAVTQYPHELLHELTMTYDSSAFSGIDDQEERRRVETYLADIADRLTVEAGRHHPELVEDDEPRSTANGHTVAVRIGRSAP